MSMKPEIKEKWVAALRSGKYEKGRGRLNYGNKQFCCLGVLCEVALAEGLELKKEMLPDASDPVFYDGGSTFLPENVRAWAGLSAMDPTINNMGAALSSLNDEFTYKNHVREMTYTFNDIANFIEGDPNL